MKIALKIIFNFAFNIKLRMCRVDLLTHWVYRELDWWNFLFSSAASVTSNIESNICPKITLSFPRTLKCSSSLLSVELETRIIFKLSWTLQNLLWLQFSMWLDKNKKSFATFQSSQPKLYISKNSEEISSQIYLLIDHQR